MEQLPSELFAKIFQSLSDNDILNLPPHIISHTLTDAKAQKLLQTIEILLERNSLERLNRISGHPNLARHIKEIRFYSPEAFPASFWDTYHGNGHPKAPKETSSYNHTKLASEQLRGKCSVRAKFTRYRMQLEEQKRMEKQQEDVLLLRIIFGHLFNLETISIDNMNKVGLRDDLNNACCYIVKEDPLEYCGSHLLEVLLKVMSTSTKKISSLKVMNDARPAWYGNGMDTMNFPAMFTKLPPNTIFSAVQELRSLKLKRVRYGIDEIQFRDAVREESCGYYWSHNACEGMKHGTIEAITEMLSSAPLLEDLTLTFYKDDRAYREPLLMPYIPLESIRGSNELQHLKRLSLANFKIRQDHLVPFLLCVAGTLTQVDIDGLYLSLDPGSRPSRGFVGSFHS